MILIKIKLIINLKKKSKRVGVFTPAHKSSKISKSLESNQELLFKWSREQFGRFGV